MDHPDPAVVERFWMISAAAGRVSKGLFMPPECLTGLTHSAPGRASMHYVINRIITQVDFDQRPAGREWSVLW
jgi:hypothetical protein